ncbi:MAG: cation transporter [Hyphomicrobiaceae bacterium]
MIRKVATAAVAIAALSPWTAQAAERTVTLSVKNVGCELCAPIVQKTLARVPGVSSAEVRQNDAAADPVAKVTFDDSKTDVNALIAATTNAGYPSRIADAPTR